MQPLAALAAIGYGTLMAGLFTALAGFGPVARVLGRAAVVTALILCPILLQAVATNQVAATARPIGDSCNVTAFANHLGSALPPRPVLGIMANADFGPHILYRTAHAVYSIPNHRLQRGYNQTLAVFTATDMEEARDLMTTAQVGVIVVCPAVRAEAYDPTGAAPENALRQRLLAGDPPDWLEVLPIPEDLATGMLAYRVLDEDDGSDP